MSPAPRDPLLLAGKGIAVFLQICMVVGAVALLAAMFGVLIFQDWVIAEFAREAANPDIVLPVLTIAAIMFVGLIIVVMLFFFFRLLGRIIDTVGEGDPFQPANAERLSRMGWLMLGTQLMLLPAGALAYQLARFADQVEDMHLTVDSGLDLEGLLLAIILFILARVFRHGAAMREDLEGTV